MDETLFKTEETVEETSFLANISKPIIRDEELLDVRKYFIMSFSIELAALLCNSFIIGIIIGNKTLRTVTDILILNLTIANMLPFFSVLIHIIEIWSGQLLQFDTMGCAFFNAITVEVLLGPSVFITFLCIDVLIQSKWQAVTFHKLSVPMVSLLLSILGWIITVSLTIPYMIFARILIEARGTWSCVIHWQHLFRYEISVAFTIPFPIILLTIFFHVINICRKSSYDSTIDDDAHSVRNLSNLSMAIAATNVTCKTPHFIYTVFLELKYIPSPKTTMVVGALYHFNGVLPPCLCLLINENYRPNIAAMFKCGSNENTTEDIELSDK